MSDARITYEATVLKKATTKGKYNKDQVSVIYKIKKVWGKAYKCKSLIQ